MLEPRILIAGIVIHFLFQLNRGIRSQEYTSSKKILGYAVLGFIISGVLMTTYNFKFDQNFGECGTKAFNPFMIISIYGSILQVFTFTLCHIILLSLSRLNGIKRQ